MVPKKTPNNHFQKERFMLVQQPKWIPGILAGKNLSVMKNIFKEL